MFGNDCGQPVTGVAVLEPHHVSPPSAVGGVTEGWAVFGCLAVRLMGGLLVRWSAVPPPRQWLREGPSSAEFRQRGVPQV